MPSDAEEDDGEIHQYVRRRCSNCGVGWDEKPHPRGTGYGCISCGSSVSNIERAEYAK